MKKLSKLILLILLIVTASITAHTQQKFTVAGIRPFERAVPGQVMEVFIEGLGPGTTPVMIPETDFEVVVSQDGVEQKATVRISKYTMVPEVKPAGSNSNTAQFSGMKMRAFHSVSFVVPQGLHLGRAEVIASYKGKRGNPVSMEIVERPVAPIVGTTSVLAVRGMGPERTGELKLAGNDLGWRLERGTTVSVFVRPLVDPDDPNSAILIRFKQDGNDYEAVTRVKTTAPQVEKHGPGIGFFVAREELEVDIPSALVLGKAQAEIRLKANGQVSDPVMVTATITDVTRVAEAPAVSAPRVLSVTPRRIGAGQSLLLSIDQRRTLEPSPKETRVIVEQDKIRYFATIEQDTSLNSLSNTPDAPVAIFVRTTRELIGRVQVRVLNPLRDEQTGLSAPVDVEIVDDVLAPELTSVREATDGDLAPLKDIYRRAREAGKEFKSHEPGRRYLAVRVGSIDYNPKFVRITLEQGGKQTTLSYTDFASFSGDGLIIMLPKGLAAGEVKFTIENFAGDDRYSTPVTKTFTLQSPS